MLYRQMKQTTVDAFGDPRPGDHFQEMYTFHVFVTAVETDGRVAVLRGSAPISFPEEGEQVVYESHEAYREAYRYGHGVEGYWVTLRERDADVTGWFTGWGDPPEEPTPGWQLVAGMLAARWRPSVDDTIGGWCVVSDADPRTPAQGNPQIADFLGDEIARHVADLHNAWLTDREGNTDA